jgi:hypothetical protein
LSRAVKVITATGNVVSFLQSFFAVYKLLFVKMLATMEVVFLAFLAFATLCNKNGSICVAKSKVANFANVDYVYLEKIFGKNVNDNDSGQVRQHSTNSLCLVSRHATVARICTKSPLQMHPKKNVKPSRPEGLSGCTFRKY